MGKIKNLTVGLFLMIVLYFIVVFAELHFNPILWHQGTRFLFALIDGVILVASIVFDILDNK